MDVRVRTQQGGCDALARGYLNGDEVTIISKDGVDVFWGIGDVEFLLEIIGRDDWTRELVWKRGTDDLKSKSAVECPGCVGKGHPAGVADPNDWKDSWCYLCHGTGLVTEASEEFERNAVTVRQETFPALDAFLLGQELQAARDMATGVLKSEGGEGRAL